MSRHQGRIVGDVTYREGDGVEINIPRGPIQIERTPLDATLTWIDGKTHGAAAIPLAELERHLASGALTIDGVSSPGA